MNNKLKSSKSSSECIKIRKVKISSFRIKKSPSTETGMFSPKNPDSTSKLESNSTQDTFKSSVYNQKFQYSSQQGSDDDSVIMTWKELLTPCNKKSFLSQEEEQCSCLELNKGNNDRGRISVMKKKKKLGSILEIIGGKADRLD